MSTMPRDMHPSKKRPRDDDTLPFVYPNADLPSVPPERAPIDESRRQTARPPPAHPPNVVEPRVPKQRDPRREP
jgi:hypothetical protein